MSSSDGPSSFLAKANAATQRIATASATVQQNATPQQAKIVSDLAKDRPTIHAAVTSFLSLVAARSLVTTTATSNDQQQQHQHQQCKDLVVLSNAEALKCSRALLKAINSTTLCATATTTATTTKNNNKSTTTPQEKEQEEEYNLVAQLWNGLIASEQKPARFLGRRAMKHAWDDVKSTILVNINIKNKNITNDKDEEEAEKEKEKLLQFTNEFERLLFFHHEEEDEDDDDDSALIWDNDGGKAELQRRRERREKRAKEATTKEEEGEEQKLPLIEELPEDNNEPITSINNSKAATTE